MTYLLSCYRYIELNPARAKRVSNPGEYRWSSYHHNGLGRDDPLISEHTLYVGLGRDRAMRLRCYRELFDTELERTEIGEIRVAAEACMPLGDNRFKAQIEAALKCRVVPRRRGRPRSRGRG